LRKLFEERAERRIEVNKQVDKEENAHNFEDEKENDFRIVEARKRGSLPKN